MVGNAFAFVTHGQTGFVAGTKYLHRHGRPVGAILDGIGEQVDNRPFQTLSISLEPQILLTI